MKGKRTGRSIFKISKVVLTIYYTFFASDISTNPFPITIVCKLSESSQAAILFSTYCRAAHLFNRHFSKPIARVSV